MDVGHLKSVNRKHSKSSAGVENCFLSFIHILKFKISVSKEQVRENKFEWKFVAVIFSYLYADALRLWPAKIDYAKPVQSRNEPEVRISRVTVFKSQRPTLEDILESREMDFSKKQWKLFCQIIMFPYLLYTSFDLDDRDKL